MTIRYDIDLEKNVIFMGAYGVISVADIASAITDIESYLEMSDHMTLVLELREIKRAFLAREMDRLIALMANDAARFVGHYAFVVSRDTMMGVGRRFAIKARRKGLKIVVFNDYAAADSWLKLTFNE